jgi:hypothetical protein
MTSAEPPNMEVHSGVSATCAGLNRPRAASRRVRESVSSFTVPLEIGPSAWLKGLARKLMGDKDPAAMPGNAVRALR